MTVKQNKLLVAARAAVRKCDRAHQVYLDLLAARERAVDRYQATGADPLAAYHA